MHLQPFGCIAQAKKQRPFRCRGRRATVWWRVRWKEYMYAESRWTFGTVRDPRVYRRRRM